MRVYFDNAATTPLDPEVLKEMYKVMENQLWQSVINTCAWREARTLIERSRKTIANLLHTSPAEIFFTSSGTEADNTAIRCGIIDHNITHAITSHIEHHAVLHTLEAMEKSGIIKLSFVNIDSKGKLITITWKLCLKDNARSFVSIMHANNEIGTLSDMNRIRRPLRGIQCHLSL
jgi:cysteine desulfurase